MGLNSGQVVVGAIGDDLRMDYTASGDITHVAAQLEAQAAPGEILCGETTVAAAKDAVETESLGAATVKGSEEPISRYRLLRARQPNTQMAEPRAAFVGRDVEMATLLGAVERASAEQGGVVEIEGEPGVGKSRLAGEFCASIGNRARTVQGHCITYGRQVPNVPIIDLVRSLCQIEPQTSAAETWQALTRELSAAQPDEIDALGALLGIPEAIERTANVDPATALGRTTQAILQLVALASAAKTLVIIVEDLHWADASSIVYLSALASSIKGTRCVLAVTFRPGSDPPWDTQARLERLQLTPLGSQESQQLVDTLEENASLSEHQRTQVLARGEGNPFFLQELVRAVAQGSDDDVPGDVFDVLGARIDRLDPDDKDLLRIASVVGRAFTIELVEEIAQLQSHSRPRFDHMVSLGFVAPSGPHRFTFIHALTQEVAYNGMLTQDRKHLHTAAAERLSAKALSAEDGCEEIARHHLQGTEPASAVPFLETSIGKAMRVHAMEEANAFFIDALRLLEAEKATPENIVRRVTLILQEFPVFHFTHRHDEYAALIERYVPVVDDFGEPALRGPFLAQRGHRLWIQARYEEALAALQEAATLCADAEDHANAAHAEFMSAWTYNYLGDFEQAEHHGRSALSHLESFPVPLHQTFSYIPLLLADAFRGRWDSARMHGESARRAGIEGGDEGMMSFGGAFLSFAVLASGEAEEAISIAERALATAPTDYFRGWAAAYMATAMCRASRVNEALPILEQATEFARISHHISGYMMIALYLIEARLISGQMESARELAENLHTQAREVGGYLVESHSELLLGEIDMAEGDTAAALTHFRDAVAQFERIDARDGWCHARFGEGRALAAHAETDAARSAMEAALNEYERLGTHGAPARVREAIEAI